ncbi:nicotinate-nucleotide adenylyltransferase [Paenibacillus beijingensis]|uniref:Probable nicotinate-nucleotide adenylyltransferase n=1 Tax=Paenibacillus beijingensis TaxID=1126833 RepID=A0A0D5NLX0_9BACL|nr:nicotinate-nucleotide adenylyltransferase [Paenibacillus beijingensis]AJY76251.1 nicotinic acid mononucleotide adenylyltransferase [Paenibacillus beijingensis]
MKKIGIMGGTFDPIHLGHLLAAETALEACGLDEVWFIPSAQPPLKLGDPGADGDSRLEMVRIATASHPRFKAVDLELQRGGISYSYDTAKALRKQHPDCSFAYIIGSDRINDLSQWHRNEELAELVTFIGVERPDEAADTAALPVYLRDRLVLAVMPQIGISSTDIRHRRLSGYSVRYLVTDGVYEYIAEKGLYES